MINEYIYPLRVYVEDTDFQGVVYHCNYIKFMERARSEWLESIAMGIDWQREQQIYFSVIDISIQFLKPATVHNQVEVVTSICKMTPATATFAQHLRLASDHHKIFCKAAIKIACLNHNMRPKAFPNMPISLNMQVIK